MAISEKIELLGKGLYKDIPDTLTLTSIPTASELDYVGGEDFNKTMLENIFPKAIQEDVDFKQLLEIDFQWICRCLRILNYGPYYTTNAIYCAHCGSHYGEYRVNLETIGCKALPEGFVNDIIIKKEEFLDFNGDIHIKLPTIQQMMNAEKDKAFTTPNGDHADTLARMCYMITSIKGKNNLTPLEIKLMIQKEFSDADFKILKYVIQEVSDYGLRAGGRAQCPECHDMDATFIALMDDRFFRPTVGDLREWKLNRSGRKDEDVPANKTGNV